MKFVFILLSTFASFAVNAQRLFVYDSKTKKPVSNAFIFNEPFTHSALTNNKGTAQLDGYNSSDRIFIQHASYKTIVTTLQQLDSLNFKVFFEPSNLRLGEVTVSANKWEQDLEEVPNYIRTISKREISFYSPQTSADLLDNTGEVFVQKSQLGGGSPMVRGFAANKVLLVVDGVRMNNAIFRGGNLQNIINVDPLSLESSEVIFGPGSIIYGSDALGGVLDFHTITPLLSTSDTFRVSGSATGRYASVINEKTAHFHIKGGHKKWAFATSFTHSKFGDLVMGRSDGFENYKRPFYVETFNGDDSIFINQNPYLQKGSGYDQTFFLQKLRYRPNDFLDISYSLIASTTSNIPRYDRLIQTSNEDAIEDTLKYAQWFYGPQEWLMNRLFVKYSKKNVLFDRSKITIAHQLFKESRHKRKFSADNMGEQFENVDAITANLDFEKKIQQHELFYGVEYVLNIIQSWAHERTVRTNILFPYNSRYPNGKNVYNTLAAYISYKHEFTKTFFGTAGARYSHVILDSEIKDNLMMLPVTEFDINTGALTGALGAVKLLPDIQSKIALNFSSGFRAPNLDDIAKVFDSEPGIVVVPNDNIGSEYAYNADLTLSKEFDNQAFVRLTGFYTLVQDAIVRRNFTINGQDSILYDGEMSKVKTNVNAGEAIIYGASADLQVSIVENFSFRMNFTYTHGEDDDGMPLRHVSPTFMASHLIYEISSFKADLYARYNGEIGSNQMAPSERGKKHMYALDENGDAYSPQWYTLNCQVAYQVNQKFRFVGGVQNILDRMYRPYSSGIVAGGRNFSLSLHYSF